MRSVFIRHIMKRARDKNITMEEEKKPVMKAQLTERENNGQTDMKDLVVKY